MLFPTHPLQISIQQWITQTYPNSELKILTTDGIQLHGWLLKKKSFKEKTPLVIYFGGNIKEVSYLAYRFKYFADYSLLLINYRGYGLSEGYPSEKHLFNDAVTIFDTIIQRQDIDVDRIVTMGRSLGSGIAVYLAAHRPLKAVILTSPYDSMVNFVKRNYSPYIPGVLIELLFKHPFNSIALAPFITVPVLTIVGQQDTIITPTISQSLMEKWGGIHKTQIIEGVDHTSIVDSTLYWETIKKFLNQFTP